MQVDVYDGIVRVDGMVSDFQLFMSIATSWIGGKDMVGHCVFNEQEEGWFARRSSLGSLFVRSCFFFFIESAPI